MFENLPCAFCYHHFVALNRAFVIFLFFLLPGGGTFSSWCLPIWSNLVCDHTRLSPGFRLCRRRSCFWLFSTWAQRWFVLMEARVRTRTPAAGTPQVDTAAARCRMWVPPGSCWGDWKVYRGENGKDSIIANKGCCLSWLYRLNVAPTICTAATRGRFVTWNTTNVSTKLFLCPGWADFLPPQRWSTI